MGLDITAYSDIKKLNATLDDDGEAIDNATGEALQWDGMWFSTWVNPDFPGRADDVEDGAVYSYQDCTGHSIGYGGHYWWRNKLAEIAGYPLTEQVQYGRIETCHFAGATSAESGPFFELINFSDCEGVIGTAISRKLAKDFADFEEKAKSEGGHFYENYQHWKNAFDMASNNGCVRFH
ncbi:hypothetical protein ACRPHP_16695 [Pantoea allii]|uniref:hypothetical protein n=1 Tax=Pantoea allii TaxID=574096 RepID=UPI003D79276C